MLGQGQSLKARQALRARPFQISKVVLGALARNRNLGFAQFSRL